MGRIPVQTEGTQQIQVSSVPQATGQGLARDMAAQKGMVSAIEGAEDTLVAVRDFRESNEASNYAFEQQQAIKAEAAQDPNFDSSKYETMLQKVGNDAGKTVSGRLAREKFMADYTRQSSATMWGIRNDFRDKEIKTAKAAISYNGKQIVANYGDMNPAEQVAAPVGYRLKLQDAVKNGIMSQPEADVELMTFQNDIQKGIIKTDIYSDNSTQEDQSIVLAELKKGSDGKYAFLPHDERVKMMEESQRRIFQNNQTLKRSVEVSQDQRNDAFIDKLASGTATFKDVDAEFTIPESQGGMKRSVLDQYQRRLQMGVTNDLNVLLREKTADKDPTQRAKQVKEYNDLIDKFIDDAGDQWKAKEELAKGFADGNLDAKELKILTPLKSNLKDIEFNRNTSPMAMAIKEVKRFMKSSNASDEDIAIRTKQLINGIGDGGKPQEEMKKIMDAEMTKHFPDYTTYSKDGKLKVDNTTGRSYRIYPDGTWKWEGNQVSK